MKGRKQVLGFVLGNVEKSRHIDDVKHVYLSVYLFNVIDPAKELLDAAPYKDNSLAHVQKKVQRLNQLGLKNWLETSFSRTRIDFQFQGGIADPRYYAVHADRLDMDDKTIELLVKIKRASGDLSNMNGDLLKRMIEALQKLKAVEVTRDKEGDFFHVVKEPSALVADLFKEVVKDESANLAAH